MIEIAAATLVFWAERGIEPATAADVAAIERVAASPLPADYVAFVTKYGFPRWSPDTPARFEHRHDLGHRQVMHEDELGGLMTLDAITQSMAGLPEALETLSPAIERAMPFAGTNDGHAILIIELAPRTGRVWHWSDESTWMDFDGPTLGFVADSFSAFVTGLRPSTDPDADKTEERRDHGQRRPAPAGFTLARETRDAWMAYGLGAAPEPEDELTAIEGALGGPLPEALRSFLSTYGYVIWPSDGIAWFDLPAEASESRAQIGGLYSTVILAQKIEALGSATVLPIGNAGSPDGEILIGLDGEDAGAILYRPDGDTPPVRVARDLRAFLASLYALGPR